MPVVTREGAQADASVEAAMRPGDVLYRTVPPASRRARRASWRWMRGSETMDAAGMAAVAGASAQAR